MKAKRSTLELLPRDDLGDDMRTVQLHRHNDGGISMTIPSNHIMHLERWFRRKCALDLWELDIYPNIKEVSEAESVRHCVVQKLKLNEGSYYNLAIIVGDGRTPRLGALLAFTTAWQVISIDPMLKEHPGYSGIKRLHLIRNKIENVLPANIPDFDINRIVICHPHSHANPNDSLRLIRDKFPGKPIDMVAMPCCVRQSIDGRKNCDIRYEDLGIWSARNIIQIWRSL